MGQRKGPSGANAPPVHGIKKCLGDLSSHFILVNGDFILFIALIIKRALNLEIPLPLGFYYFQLQPSGEPVDNIQLPFHCHQLPCRYVLTSARPLPHKIGPLVQSQKLFHSDKVQLLSRRLFYNHDPTPCIF